MKAFLQNLLQDFAGLAALIAFVVVLALWAQIISLTLILERTVQ